MVKRLKNVPKGLFVCGYLCLQVCRMAGDCGFSLCKSVCVQLKGYILGVYFFYFLLDDNMDDHFLQECKMGEHVVSR